MKHDAFLETTALLGGILLVALYGGCASAQPQAAASQTPTHITTEASRDPFVIELVRAPAPRQIVVAGIFAGGHVVLKWDGAWEGGERMLIGRGATAAAGDELRPMGPAEAALFASMLERSVDGGRLDEESEDVVREMVQALRAHATSRATGDGTQANPAHARGLPIGSLTD